MFNCTRIMAVHSAAVQLLSNQNNEPQARDAATTCSSLTPGMHKKHTRQTCTVAHPAGCKATKGHATVSVHQGTRNSNLAVAAGLEPALCRNTDCSVKAP